MTTDVVSEGESAAELPSVKDVVKELTAVRQHEGLSARRIKQYGKRIQLLRISQEEFHRAGSEPGTLPMATMKALQCAVKSFHPESIYALVLAATLNLDGRRSLLNERQTDLAKSLGILSPTTYEGVEREVYDTFGFTITHAQRSFCEPDAATAIAALPKAELVAIIRLLLGMRIGDYKIDQNVSADELLRLLPNLSSIPWHPPLVSKPVSILDRLLQNVADSKAYSVERANVTGVLGELAIYTNDLILERIRSRKPFSLQDIADAVDWRAAKLNRARYARLLREIPSLKWWQRLRLRIARHGLFFSDKHVQPTPAFDQLLYRGMDSLAAVIVDVERGERWPEVFPPPKGGRAKDAVKDQPDPKRPEQMKPGGDEVDKPHPPKKDGAGSADE